MDKVLYVTNPLGSGGADSAGMSGQNLVIFTQNHRQIIPVWGGADCTGTVAPNDPEWVALIRPEYSMTIDKIRLVSLIYGQSDLIISFQLSDLLRNIFMYHKYKLLRLIECFIKIKHFRSHSHPISPMNGFS